MFKLTVKQYKQRLLDTLDWVDQEMVQRYADARSSHLRKKKTGSVDEGCGCSKKKKKKQEFVWTGPYEEALQYEEDVLARMKEHSVKPCEIKRQEDRILDLKKQRGIE